MLLKFIHQVIIGCRDTALAFLGQVFAQLVQDPFTYQPEIVTHQPACGASTIEGDFVMVQQVAQGGDRALVQWPGAGGGQVNLLTGKLAYRFKLCVVF